ncbi:hypothetical protein BBK36DRAFT_1199627 [Trichoderma citrinoviride]|uniref:Uncharacterized protein n=1 Tax=Trichoderma citrinoviride TaxID=58853 RepID=A0A2T4BCR0_9HYPO|nr:hypothetical protein BBK36DRAFT_1199627 [Trichoderma citrinoviride]PTB67114.1 hypothetical protein BBK36DRAFT_1199627 [Trichoderma citrinoviride]
MYRSLPGYLAISAAPSKQHVRVRSISKHSRVKRNIGWPISTSATLLWCANTLRHDAMGRSQMIWARREHSNLRQHVKSWCRQMGQVPVYLPFGGSREALQETAMSNGLNPAKTLFIHISQVEHEANHCGDATAFTRTTDQEGIRQVPKSQASSRTRPAASNFESPQSWTWQASYSAQRWYM